MAKYKLNKSLIANAVTVVIEPTMNLINLEIIKNNLEKLFFNDINFIKLTSLFKINRKNNLIIFNNNYLYLIKQNYQKPETIFIDYRLFNFQLEVLTNHLYTLINNKSITIFGFNNKVEELATLLAAKSNNKVYFVVSPEKYILKNVKYIKK